MRTGQMFSNLLGNALMHGAPDHPVRVKAITTDNQFELSVDDSGEPTPVQSLNKLFNLLTERRVRKARGWG
ncbi:ATP-binding protein [Rhizobium sp. RAF36]|uniref:ATP-binding protein n=1 Tax=Rhizobium sp. RAF36 TaxID=3233055 RepID=UPI000DDA123F